MRAHFSELLLWTTMVTLLAFSVFMSHVHNDSLASKGMEFTGQALAALLTLMVASKQTPPPPGTTTTNVQTQSTTPVAPPPENVADVNPLRVTP